MFSIKFTRSVLNLSSITRRLSATQSKIVIFKTTETVYSGKAQTGDSLLDVMLNNDIPLDGFGACEGTLACCTCHVILSKEYFDKVDKVNPAGEEELDLLDLAPDLNDFSRLGCQIKIDQSDPDVIEVVVPSVQRDARNLLT